MKKLFAHAVTLGLTLSALALLSQPAVAAPISPPPVMLTDSTPKGRVTVAPGGTVTVMLAGQLPPGHNWLVAWGDVACTDVQNARRNDGGALACLDPDFEPQLNAFGNAYVSYIQAPDVPTTVRISYTSVSAIRADAGDGRNAVKVYEVEVGRSTLSHLRAMKE